MPNQKWDPEWEPSALAMLPLQLCSLHLAGGSSTAAQQELGNHLRQNLQVTQVDEVLQAMTAGPLLAAQAGFSVPGVLQMPFSIYRNKASTCQYKLLITEDWGSCIASVKSVRGRCCCRLHFSWFKVQLHSSGMVSPGQADAQTVIVWLYEPWMDMPLNASILLHFAHCCFPCDCWMLLRIFQMRPWCSSLWAQLPPQEALAVPSSAPVLWPDCPGVRGIKGTGCSGCTRRAQPKCKLLCLTCFEWG